ncbi:MAG: coproporphyrinogen-III oxidase family protein [Candidatus Cryptobacteroides sp.]
MVYVHIPFCRSFCTYCGFYSEIPDRVGDDGTAGNGWTAGNDGTAGNVWTDSFVIPGLTGNLPQRTSESDGPGSGPIEDFVEALCREAALRTDEIRSCKGTGTLYIGGGTPSILSLDGLGRIVLAVRKALGEEDGGTPFREFTVEVNPDDIVRKGHDYIRGLVRLGVNRISMGVQSFDDRVLRRMNRRHSASDAAKAFRILRECGVENISIDLIFGFPADFGNGDCGTTVSGPLDYWRETLRKALEIGGDGRPPEHISAYQLSIEEGSALEKMVAEGRFTPLSDELCSAQYDLLCSTLSAAGYNHYEISNFALSGKEAVHNSAYWNHTPYVGLGPGAHSLVRQEPGHNFVEDLTEESDGTFPAGGPDGGKKPATRKWNIDDVRAYINAYRSIPSSPAPGNRECGREDTTGARAVTGEEILTAEQYRTETIMLSLRTSGGIPRHILETTPASAAKVRILLACGSLVPVEGASSIPRLRIPEDRFFVSDDIIAELI